MANISNYFGEKNTDTVDNDIVYKLYLNVKNDCIALIEKGYENYLSDREVKFSEDETIITAGLYKHIDLIICDSDLPFEVTPERPQYTKAIKNGLVNPKKAKRFDLLFVHFHSKPRFKIGIEAKLLAETDTSTKRASYLINEYVHNKGMGKFINRLYEEDGFMLGYILNGFEQNIITKINIKITKTYSIERRIKNCGRHYASSYVFDGNPKELVHIFLNFTGCFKGQA